MATEGHARALAISSEWAGEHVPISWLSSGSFQARFRLVSGSFHPRFTLVSPSFHPRFTLVSPSFEAHFALPARLLLRLPAGIPEGNTPPYPENGGGVAKFLLPA